jgi:hypothetical protein
MYDNVVFAGVPVPARREPAEVAAAAEHHRPDASAAVAPRHLCHVWKQCETVETTPFCAPTFNLQIPEKYATLLTYFFTSCTFFFLKKIMTFGLL